MFEAGQTVKLKVQLALDDKGGIIPVGAIGKVVHVSAKPSGVNAPAKWFGVDVWFDGYLSEIETYPCADDEIEIHE